MSCYRPWAAYKHPNGLVNQKQGPDAESIRLPCGGCIGCRLERSKIWSLRCRHEASCWTHNVFLTLTYDDKSIPWHGSLSGSEPRLFIRYLRRRLSGAEEAPDGSGRRPIRYFGCGEYGSQRGRAHYHLLLFNVQFTDVSRYGKDTFTSSLVSELWKQGSHLIGSLTPASASYVSGYALKKVRGWDRERVYGIYDETTGEFLERKPEFAMMSLKPPIGFYWYEKYKRELRNGFVIADGERVAIPRLYRDKLAVDDPALHEEMCWRKYSQAKSFDPADRSEERLAVREYVAESRRSFFSRSHLED